jgi:hypothetical protein
MKNRILIVCIALALCNEGKSQEKYGNTINAGLGLGYIGYYYGAAPTFAFDYEFDVFKNFTLAPFIAVSTYRSYRYLGDNNNIFGDYYFRETMVPVGIKACYYLDELFEANEHWDFYLGGSAGLIFRTVSWDTGYSGNRVIRSNYNPTSAYGALHLGAEYHINRKVGVFLDLSSAYSTLGLGIHL